MLLLSINQSAERVALGHAMAVHHDPFDYQPWRRDATQKSANPRLTGSAVSLLETLTCAYTELSYHYNPY